MTLWQTTFLGALAGFTIYLGLPIARLRQRKPTWQSLLTAIALGILLFLLWDILSKALEPISAALKQGSKTGTWAGLRSLLTMLVLGLMVGLIGLVAFDMRVVRHPAGDRKLSKHLALMIAAGLGLHNFSEGLVIGQAAATGAVGFAAVLIVGFGLHNITEGFAIAAPLATSAEVPSWMFLGAAGLIGGGPTLLGTLVGYHVVAPLMFVFFLALAAGALFYIIGEMFAAGRRASVPLWTAWGILVGFLMAYATDLVLTIAGM